MIIKGIEVARHELSYDKIIKNTLAQSDEMAIGFINGLFGGGIPPGAKVEWLDKESVDDGYKAIVADFYPRIDGRMYSIEVEADDNGDMAVRVFRYALGGALRHGMIASGSELTVEFPQPCVVFLRSDAGTPKKLTWRIKFFDGDEKTLDIPLIRLTELSVKEIAERSLMPIGQFYLRTFEPLTKSKIDGFRTAGAELLAALRDSMERGAVPYHLAVEMQETIRKTAENAVSRAGTEVDFDMTTNIVETLPWIDYGELFEKIEARSRTERDSEIALRAFERRSRGTDVAAISQMLGELGIPSETIESARRQHEANRPPAPKRPSDPES
jgi:hypothetical protein